MQYKRNTVMDKLNLLNDDAVALSECGEGM